MKTHELAKTLNQLARVLSSGPDVEIDHLDMGRWTKPRTTRTQDSTSQWDALLSLDKRQLVQFVEQFRIPINLRPRDAKRDVLGKITKCLNSDPELRKRVSIEIDRGSREVSPALSKALAALLRDRT